MSERTDYTDDELQVLATRTLKLSEFVYQLDPCLHLPKDQVIIDMARCLASVIGGIVAPLLGQLDEESFDLVLDMIEVEVIESAKHVLEQATAMRASGQISGARN